MGLETSCNFGRPSKVSYRKSSFFLFAGENYAPNFLLGSCCWLLHGTEKPLARKAPREWQFNIYLSSESWHGASQNPPLSLRMCSFYRIVCCPMGWFPLQFWPPPSYSFTGSIFSLSVSFCCRARRIRLGIVKKKQLQLPTERNWTPLRTWSESIQTGV